MHVALLSEDTLKISRGRQESPRFDFRQPAPVMGETAEVIETATAVAITSAPFACSRVCLTEVFGIEGETLNKHVVPLRPRLQVRPQVERERIVEDDNAFLPVAVGMACE